MKPDATEAERRLALADWIASPDNPLPARVMVNRVWHYHFGQGIVRTPSDFGYNGDRPSHPELLDWLASEYQAGGWRLKPLHRLIVLSSAYRQSTRYDDKAAAADADDRLLWRRAPRRLEAEAIRDAVLQTSGALNPARRPRLQSMGLFRIRDCFHSEKEVGAGRVPADGLPVQAAFAAGPDVRRLRLPRRHADDAAAAPRPRRRSRR